MAVKKTTDTKLKAEKATETCCTTDGKKCCCCKNNPYITVTTILSGIYFALAVMFMMFSNSNMEILVPILWGFIFFELIAVVAIYKTKKNKSE